MKTVNLWKSSFKAGKTMLGGNADEPAKGFGSNYFVIVTGKADGVSVDPQFKLSTTWSSIKSD